MKPAGKRLGRVVIPYLLPLVVGVLAAIYFSRNYEQFRQIKVISCWWFIFLVASSLATIVPAALILRNILRFFQVNLGFWESVGLVFITGMGNYIVPYVGGVGLRATYLRKRYNLPLGYFAGTAGGAVLLSTLLNSIIGLVMVCYLYFTRQMFNPVILLLFVAFIAMVAVFILMPMKGFKSENRLLLKMNQVWEGWKIIRSQRRADLIALLFYAALSSVVGILVTYSSFRVITEFVSPAAAAIISAMAALSHKISVTPAGLGIRELVIVFTSQALGYLLVVNVSVALIQRLVSAGIVFIGGGISSYLLSRTVLESPPVDKSV